MVDEWGQQETIHTADNNMFSLTGDWIDNNTFVTVLIRDNHDVTAGNFHICAYNLSAKQRAILYEQYVSNAYPIGVLVSTNRLSLLHICR
ncbi:hypothetical protein JCM15765_05350 [Paradesulfitobacterium aromaticivorans]